MLPQEISRRKRADLSSIFSDDTFVEVLRDNLPRYLWGGFLSYLRAIILHRIAGPGLCSMGNPPAKSGQFLYPVAYSVDNHQSHQ